LILLFYVNPAFGLPYAINLCLFVCVKIAAEHYVGGRGKVATSLPIIWRGGK